MISKGEADTRLRQAIEDHAAAYGLAEPDEMLSDFAVIASWLPPIGESAARHRYTTQYQAEEVPIHMAHGLFSIGVKLTSDYLEEDE